jgi:dephospho-CoA kinase
LKIYGLTGSIASGKSTASRLFSDLGVPVLDADQVARSLRAPGTEGEAFLQKTFNTTDAKEIRNAIFQSPERKKELEEFFHPRIQAASEKWFRDRKNETPETPYLLYEAALLIEADRHQDFDGVILVTAPRDDQINRLLLRDSISAKSAGAILDSQLSVEDKKKFAHFILENNGSVEDLRQKVTSLHQNLIIAPNVSRN